MAEQRETAEKLEGEHNPHPTPVAKPIKGKVGAGVSPATRDENIEQPDPHAPPRRPDATGGDASLSVGDPEAAAGDEAEPGDIVDRSERAVPADADKIRGTSQREPGWGRQHRSDQARDTEPEREDRTGTPKKSA